MCVRTPIEQLVLDTPNGAESIPAEIATEPTALPHVDWVLLTTKVQDVPQTEPWLRALDAADKPIVVVQNGVEHQDSLAGFGLSSPILPTLIYVAAERVQPGHVVRRSIPSMVVPTSDLGQRFQDLLQESEIHWSATDDFRTAAWRKMLTNLAANPITALTLRRLDVFEESETRRLAADVLTEAVRVARAEGAALTQEDADRVLRTYTANFSARNGSSMLYDRLAGLPTEHEHITAPLVRAAARHGIPVPHNQTLLTLLRAINPTPVTVDPPAGRS